MARKRIHLRLIVLSGVAAGALSVVWTLAYGLASGDIPLFPLVLGPVVGILTALAAARLSGHPAGAAPHKPSARPDDRPAAVPARGAR